MAERTITISSAAKMFNVTGWKIGWACGPADLIAGVRAAKQFLTYVGGAPFQPAVAQALDTEDAWVAALRDSLQAKRDRLARGADRHRLRRARQRRHLLPVRRPAAAGLSTDSTTFCAELPDRAGVAAIPMSAFCDPGGPLTPDEWNHLVRFAFCKRDDTMDDAIRRLQILRR